MKLTILQKPGRLTAKNFNWNLEKALHDLKGELSSSIKLDGFSQKGWARIELTGNDSEVLLELAARKFGRAQTELMKIEQLGVYEGVVVGAAGDGVEVDVGIETPKPANVKIGVETLRAQLADGKTMSLNGIIQEYCLFPGNKASVRITHIDSNMNRIQGWFADSHIELLSTWIGNELDRILIFDCYTQEVAAAIKKSNLERDIVSVEPVSLTAQSAVCKLGTDAVGMIPKLGRILSKHELKPFIPRRIKTRCRPW